MKKNAQFITITTVLFICAISILMVLAAMFYESNKTQKQQSTNTVQANENTNAKLSEIDEQNFTEMAKKAGCADNRNDMYVIDDKMVFWAKEGSCMDASYGFGLYGNTKDQILCSSGDTIAGPRESCSDENYYEMLNTITKNLDGENLGLDASHQVRKIY